LIHDLGGVIIWTRVWVAEAVVRFDRSASDNVHDEVEAQEKDALKHLEGSPDAIQGQLRLWMVVG
jgi:hypothetical protein